MKIEVCIGKARGRVTAPPSKSVAHRLLIAAALYRDECEVTNVAFSEDISRTLDCLEALGCRLRKGDGSVSFSGREPLPGGTLPLLPCGESGSTLRFMIPIALAIGGEFRFTCSERLRERGIAGYSEMFRENDISCSCTQEGFLLRGALKPGLFKVDLSSSSQYLSGIMMALPLIGGESRVEIPGEFESASYADVTREVMRIIALGERSYAVEGDWSNAAYLEAFNLIGGELEIDGLNPDSYQGDRRYRTFFKELSEGFAHIDISDNIDLGPVLFSLAALLHGAEFTGTHRLTIKESDRASAMLSELARFGVRHKMENNRVTIFKSELHSPAEPLDGHNDHRVVMALCLPLSIYGGTIKGAEAVRKSFPDYFETLGRVGIRTIAPGSGEDPAEGITPSLREYVESSVIPRYDHFDKGHDRQHVNSVIMQAMELCSHYPVNRDIVYAAAAYHDTGLCEGREHHHTASARIIRGDAALRRWFSEEEIGLIADAAEDHRASSKSEPRGIYGKIIAEADRQIDPADIIRRTVLYSLSHYPELDKEGHWNRTLEHLHEKYAEGGYLRLWIPESPNSGRLTALRSMISDKNLLREYFEKYYICETNLP